MRITAMTNMAKSLRPPPPDPDPELSAETATKLITEIGADLRRLKWFLWHGNVFRALQIVEDITADLATLHPDGEPTKQLKAVRGFDSYLRANTERIPNYGERRRAGETISTAFVKSTVTQVISKRMVKKQQMRWTPRGAHLLLPGPHPSPQEHPHRRLPALVPQLHPHHRSPDAGRITSPGFSRSRVKSSLREHL
jgi:hypothetical protein